MKTLIRIVQFLVGALFLFSGFIKAVDPLGTSYKMHDYFTAFQNDWPSMRLLWDFMSTYSTQLAVFMLVLELALGFALMLFFTFLTGYTYLSGYTMGHWYNPSTWVFNAKDMKVTDCGCFGDFIKLKPYTSFYKDVVLDVLILILLIGSARMYSLFRDRFGNIVVGLGTFAAYLFCL